MSLKKLEVCIELWANSIADPLKKLQLIIYSPLKAL